MTASVFSEKVAARFRLSALGGMTATISTGSACPFSTPVTFWSRPGFLLARNWKASTGPRPWLKLKQPARLPRTAAPTRTPMRSLFMWLSS